MTKLWPLIFALSFQSCLNFGEDVETTSPTPTQIARCRAEMYLNPQLEFEPLGFKLVGSGIDDAIWFKFRIDTKNITSVFQDNLVRPKEFSLGRLTHDKSHKPGWWDIHDKTVLVGKFELPRGRFMEVGIDRRDTSSVVYIHWFET